PGRVGAWARRFAAAGGATYRFGLAEDGYARLGRLVLDERQDCISLVYRVTELARAADPRDAVAWALRTRFAGARPAEIVDERGLVDYDHPVHLDYSLDMVRSGRWGEDVTARLTGARPDSLGTARYAAGSFAWVPEGALVPGELHEGDVAWLVLDPQDQKARALRDDHGLVVGHAGIVIVRDGAPWLVHAASSPLAGWYEGDGVFEVPLGVYLERVERYGGVVVTRFEGGGGDR
ncbi:MAG: hypothetical protein IH621_13905, partial [Krumholzibacteria bacterium]|nr:hypothetical protein [Candidatus Krumholzibacteria bacterium]